MSEKVQGNPTSIAADQQAGTAIASPSDDNLKALKNISDLASSCMGLLLKISVVCGGAILLIYAALEGFFYDTSSIAAISILVFVVSAFVALVLLLLIYGGVTSVWFIALILWFGRRRTKRSYSLRLIPFLDRREVWGFSLFMFCLLALAVLVGWQAGKSIRFEDMLYSWIAGFLIVIVLGVKSERNKPSEQTNIEESATVGGELSGNLNIIWRILGAFLVPLLLLSSVYHETGRHLVYQTMTMLSFRTEPPQPVLLADQAYHTVSAIADAEAISVSSCQLKNGQWLLGGVTVVWHGVGMIAYLRIHGKSGDSVLIAVPSADMTSVIAQPAERQSIPAFQRNGGRC